MTIVAPATIHSAVPLNAPKSAISESWFISAGMTKKNQATLAIRKSVANSRNRQSRPVLIEGIEESSPPIAGRLVELRSLGLQLPLEVSAAHDDRAGVALNRRHSLEGKGAAVAAGVLAGAAHAAFGMVGHGVESFEVKTGQAGHGAAEVNPFYG